MAKFCRSVKVSWRVFYKIRGRAVGESTAALHSGSPAPRQPAGRYGPEVVNEFVKIHKCLKMDGWDYGSRSVHYEAALQDVFPGGLIPSVATIVCLLNHFEGRTWIG
jgi:hypothetical protein